ncbi:BolA family protein, partial [Salmonella sp. s51228]|uniref:BolA family protein n=1 Tax=Salmonella sp. s51228 TaxID=3159652 RepID=UPI00397F0675
MATSESDCKCPSDEDKLSALKSENITRVDKIRQLLTAALNPTQLDIEDMSGGCGAMFSVTIASELFKDKKMIQQHRMVNDVLKEELKTIHA